MPYPPTPYGILITTLAQALTEHCLLVGETVNWLTYSNTKAGASGQHGGVVFNVPSTTTPANNELEIIVRTMIWRPTPQELLADAGDAFDYLDRYLRSIALAGLRVTVGGRPYDLFRGWRVQSAYLPEDHINIDQGRSLVLEWICIWHTEGLLREDWAL